jgi:hypothetical protein
MPSMDLSTSAGRPDRPVSREREREREMKRERRRWFSRASEGVFHVDHAPYMCMHMCMCMCMHMCMCMCMHMYTCACDLCMCM